MTHLTVTTDATHRLIAGARINGVNNVLMAVPTRQLGNGSVSRSNLDWFVEASLGKGERVVKPILSLGHVFHDKTWRRMAVVAGGHSPVTPLGPTVELLIHYMAIPASIGIIC